MDRPAREGAYVARHLIWGAKYGLVSVRRTCVEPERFCAYDQLGREYQLEELQDWHGMIWGCPDCGSRDLIEGYPPRKSDQALVLVVFCGYCGRELSGEEYAEATVVGPLRMPQEAEDVQ
jgi:DNA-directed RNA polymerase subunit RPC12/RpoP